MSSDRIEGATMLIGFIGLGNVGAKLAGSLLRNGFDLVVHDLDKGVAQPLLEGGATWANSAREMAMSCEVVVTCLPSPTACSQVLEADDGLIAGFASGGGEGKVWLEMSTTDEAEVRRMASLVQATGAMSVDCPVSGGCHRA
ncbi:MAG: NAD(P)-binding domain-containing protein, partial [Acidimicrobiales bacterium]|nr:NAD(P)-binding domain-containing protein [Acidimicrobiales bacterium]